MKKLLREYSDDNFINLTTDWLYEKYEEMNNELFGGYLGSCTMGIFTSGKGANGRVLGWFSMKRDGLRYSKSTREMYVVDYWGGRKYVEYGNFDTLCNPTIQLNGNYKWSEKAALSTLVHEMCHYYTYMNGRAPKQAHGVEFRNIAYRVSSKSNGIFTVERLAKAEQMQEMELDSAVKAKNDQRKENKINKMIPMFLYMKDGTIRMVNANSEKVVNLVVDYERRQNRVQRIDICTDRALKDFLVSKGYRTTMTTYRFWEITSKPWIKDLDNYQMKTIFNG